MALCSKTFAAYGKHSSGRSEISALQNMYFTNENTPDTGHLLTSSRNKQPPKKTNLHHLVFH
jgi:hypothetical protein